MANSHPRCVYLHGSGGFVEKICRPCLFFTRLLGRVERWKPVKSTRKGALILDWLLTAWSMTIFTITVLDCLQFLASPQGVTPSRSPTELIKNFAVVTKKLWPVLSHIGLITGFWNFAGWLQACCGTCEQYLSKANKAALCALQAVLLVICVYSAYPAIDSMVNNSHTFSHKKNSNVLDTVKDLTAPVVDVCVALSKCMAAVGQSVLILTAAALAMTFQNVCIAYTVAAPDDIEKSLNAHAALCSLTLTLRRRMDFFLLIQYAADFSWAMFLVALLQGDLTAASTGRYFLFSGQVFTFMALRTALLVILNMKASAMADAICERVRDMPLSEYKKNAAIRVQFMDREHIGFSLGGLLNVNGEFVIGLIGLFVTYILLSWDDKTTKVVLTEMKNGSLWIRS